MKDPAHATDALIGLLRLGEHLAEGAFDRIARAFTGTPLQRYQATLACIADDESRHDRWLSNLTREHAPTRMDRKARRFFVALRDSDPGIHLARIASLDGCVCQIVTRVVGGPATKLLPQPLVEVLKAIRSDEARHVRIARRLALESGTQLAQLNDIDDDTRAAFAAVLVRYVDEFERLGVDSNRLIRGINRVDR